MAWIESHQALGQHPKTLRLAAELGCSVPTAVGYLMFLWWWSVDYAPDGLLRPGSEGIVARACHYGGKPERFWSALVRAGFVDELPDGGHIHDWRQYTGRLIEWRRADAARKRAWRLAGSNRSSQLSGGHPEDGATTASLPYQPYQPYQPDLNRTNTSPPTPPSDPPKGGDGSTNGIGHPTSARICPGCGRVIPKGFPTDQPYCHEPGAQA